jgi:hypothetical protein
VAAALFLWPNITTVLRIRMWTLGTGSRSGAGHLINKWIFLASSVIRTVPEWMPVWYCETKNTHTSTVCCGTLQFINKILMPLLRKNVVTNKKMVVYKKLYPQPYFVS